jgi:PIN domain nuclease of toxin-antitoxin system
MNRVYLFQAKLVPVEKHPDDTFNFVRGKGSIVGDVVSPAFSPEEWGNLFLILLDTHIVLWVAFDAACLSQKAKTTIAEARQSGEGVAISDITLLELAMLARKKRIPLGLSRGSFLSEVERRFVVLPMNRHICVRAFALPSTYPKDPADRLIAGTALVQGLSLVTAIG